MVLGPEGAGRTAGDVGTAEGRIWDRKRAVGPPEQPRARVRRQFQARLRNFCKKGLTSARIDGIIPLAVSKSRLRYTFFRCASGGIGRLAGFRCQCSLRACGFDSRLAHQTSGRKSGGFFCDFTRLSRKNPSERFNPSEGHFASTPSFTPYGIFLFSVLHLESVQKVRGLQASAHNGTSALNGSFPPTLRYENLKSTKDFCVSAP